MFKSIDEDRLERILLMVDNDPGMNPELQESLHNWFTQEGKEAAEAHTNPFVALEGHIMRDGKVRLVPIPRQTAECLAHIANVTPVFNQQAACVEAVHGEKSIFTYFDPLYSLKKTRQAYEQAQKGGKENTIRLAAVAIDEPVMFSKPTMEETLKFFSPKERSKVMREGYLHPINLNEFYRGIGIKVYAAPVILQKINATKDGYASLTVSNPLDRTTSIELITSDYQPPKRASGQALLLKRFYFIATPQTL